MKKKYVSVGIITTLLALVMAGTMIFASGAALMGDIDGDGVITTSDARSILRFAVALDIPTEEQAWLADVDNDENIMTSDARKVLRIAIHLEDEIYADEPTTDEETTGEETTGEESTEPSSVPAASELVLTEDEDCVIAATVEDTDEDGNARSRNIVSAHRTAVGEDGEAVEEFYYRSADFFDGKDLGLILRETSAADGATEQTMILISYEKNEAVEISAELLSSMGLSVENGAYLPVYFSESLDGVAGETVSIDGTEYFVAIQEGNGVGGVNKNYMLPYEDGYVVAIREACDASGAVNKRITLNMEQYADSSDSIFALEGITVTEYNDASMSGLADLVEKLTNIGLEF